MKKIILLLCLLPQLVLSAEVDELNRIDELSYELLLRGSKVEPQSIIAVCEKQPVWCNGYFTAVIHNLKNNNRKYCMPSNNVGRQINEGIWAVIKAWLYRQPKTAEISLLSATQKALTEHKC